ncbi:MULTISPECIES: hypothetical protein [unclassified Fusibacter]|uniref:hypothetical protein n=1 Tax=unclassified Fusibacter TaxID=2624464 RepID=UPI0010132408|nr:MULTISPECIES: hypothetical protein [unclassified Fusibacter]MCK8060835.1 hypothetical protein [Fusibacter sp. A2]NPE23131.1 hypothetical protein [Fusibacter sp. A1]
MSTAVNVLAIIGILSCVLTFYTPVVRMIDHLEQSKRSEATSESFDVRGYEITGKEVREVLVRHLYRLVSAASNSDTFNLIETGVQVTDEMTTTVVYKDQKVTADNYDSLIVDLAGSYEIIYQVDHSNPGGLTIDIKERKDD